MILAIDIGNTHIVIGCMDGDDIKRVFRISTNSKRTADEYAAQMNSVLGFYGIERAAIDGAVISSVVPPLTRVFKDAVRLLTGVGAIIVGAGLRTGINILIDDPAQLGGDMVATAVGALASYDLPVIIADLGTATKMSVLDGNGGFIGGAILPGVAISMGALASGASLLPHVPIEAPAKCLCANTIDCMKSGAVFGAAASIDGMVERFEDELGAKARVVATGGLAEAIVRHCKREVIYDPDLILRGLKIIYEKNTKSRG